MFDTRIQYMASVCQTCVLLLPALCQVFKICETEAQNFLLVAVKHEYGYKQINLGRSDDKLDKLD